MQRFFLNVMYPLTETCARRHVFATVLRVYVKFPFTETRYVVLCPTKFRDNLFKFTLYTIIIYKVGDTRCHLRRHALIQHNFLDEIRTPTENMHARIVVIG